MADWEFGKGKKTCSSCNKPVADGDSLFSALFLDETKKATEQFLRNDYCSACWANKPEGVFSFWRIQVTKKVQPKTPREILVEFFENMISASGGTSSTDKLSGIDETLRPKIIYLFSLVLLRRKILKIKENITKDNQPYLVFERIPDGKLYEIPELAISDDELVKLKDQFTKLFEFEI